MQNTSQTFRGTTAPGVNFTDHTYDNHVGIHCQSSGYQPYSNSPYHPVPSPRSHHYGNHQMQQGLPYRHHGGAYAPNQTQYAPGMNQEMYRNHHSGYMNANNRNMPSKPWADNNSSSDLMPPYGQVTSHPQLLNSPSPVPVTAMRSPPHATSNMNPTPSQGQQHYRQMQSPAHSPHSWSQAQIPSPGMMHSSRTTPSPLPAHMRSPGHSQPFSPPAAHAMNLQPHHPPPENGQIPQTMNSASSNENHNPSNPLHSLQKMVMLEQDSKTSVLPMAHDGHEQFINQCGSHSYVSEEGTSNESKDSAYSTYYNMDENRFESKPNNTADDTSLYPAAQQVSNCNFTVSHPISEEIKNASTVLGNSKPNINDVFHTDQSSMPSPVSNSSTLDKNHCKSNIPQNDCSLKLNECPPHAESAPVFTDQTKEAVSTNSEQALQSSSDSVQLSELTSEPAEAHSAQIPVVDTASLSSSSVLYDPNLSANCSENADIPSPLQIKCKNSEECNKNESHLISHQKEELSVQKSDVICEADVPVSDKSETCTLKTDVKNDPCEETLQETDKPCTEDQDSHCGGKMLVAKDSESISLSKEENENDAKKPMLRQRKIGASYEEAPSPETEIKSNTPVESCSPKKSAKEQKLDCKKSPTKSPNKKVLEAKPAKELVRNPVKVVIHRIRKNNTDDETWHVPGNNKTSVREESRSVSKNDKKSGTKSQNIGPQIIILSPAMSQKKFGFRHSAGFRNSASNSVISEQEDKTVKIAEEEEMKNEISIKKERRDSSENPASESSIDKKRGRPVGSKNRLKQNALKRKRNKKGIKKKKADLLKQKVSEASKPKRIKIFNGPYIHITGSKENPSSISIVNVAQKEEEKINKTQQPKRTFSSTISRIKKKQVGHLSTLSPTYDAFNRDKTWLCIFCHKGSHHGGLGDLYGPYYIKNKNVEKEGKSTTSTPSSSRNKRRKSEHDDNKSSKKSKQSSGHSSSVQTTPVGSHVQDEESSEPSDNLKEVWIHEDCAVWCQNISLIGEDVQGLEEAVNEASENICSRCSLDGATVGCWGKGCKEQYHFTCANEKGCQMDIENFSLLCPKHQKKPADKHCRSQ